MKAAQLLRKPFAWGLADQAVSSATNFGLFIVVARMVDRNEFGAFSLAFGTFTLSLIASRALTSEPFVARYSASRADLWRDKAGAAAGTAVGLGAIIGVGCITVGMLGASFGAGSLGNVLLVLGVTMPGLLLQDVWRWIFFSQGGGASAVINDLVWAACLFAGIGVLSIAHMNSIAWFVFAWGGAAGVASILGIFQARVVPRPAASRAWWHAERGIAGRYLAEFGAVNGASQLALYAVGACAGLAALGSLRLAQLLLGPLNVLVMGIGLVAVPEGKKALKHSSGRLVSLSRFVSVSLATAALLSGGIVFFSPADIGTRLLNDAWAPAHAVVLPVAIGLAGTGIAVGALAGLRSLVAADLSLQGALVIAPIIVIGAAVGALLGNSVGAGLGLAVASWWAAAVYWSLLMRGVRRRDLGGDLWHPVAIRSTGLGGLWQWGLGLGKAR